MLPDVLVALPGMVDIFASRGGPVGLLPFFVDPGSLFTSLLPGVGAGAARPSSIAIDPDLIPEPDALRPFLFPSVTVLSVDDQGIRFISRKAFPTINPISLVVPLAIAELL